MVLAVGSGRLTGQVMMLLTRLLTLVVGELVMPSLMLVVICPGSVVAGTLLFLTFIDFSLLLLVLWSIMMVMVVLLLTLLSGLLVLPRGAVCFMRFGTGLFCSGHLVLGIRNGFMFLLLLSVLRTLLIAPIPQVSWLSGSPFQVVSIGLRLVWILELVVFLMWDCSFFMNFGLVRGCLLKRPILAIFGQGVQFQCRLFLLVQALIFGAPVVFVGAMMRSLCMLLRWC